MFKPCPKCGFLVALIAGREASQRCPRCGSALLTEAELLDIEEAAARPPLRREERDTPAGVAAAETVARRIAADEPDAPAEEAQPADRIEPDVEPDPAGSPAAHDGPSFARRRSRERVGGPRWPWLLGLALLSVLLAAQLLLAQRVELARDAGWRPLVMRTCALLRCDVPAWREPQAFAMLAREVRPHPTRAGVLHVTATVRNDARWPQPPPVVVLSLSDVDGRVVGARAVPPADYGHRASGTVAPGASVDIAFDVREPTARVESFDFQLQ